MFSAGTGIENSTCGATRLGAVTHPLSAYYHMPNFVNGDSTLRLQYSARKAFPVALRSPFSLTLDAAITPSATLSLQGGQAYLLSLNGLVKFNISQHPMQQIMYLLNNNYYAIL